MTKILFANHHLEILAGSELATLELAKACRRRGHDVSIFTFFKGAVAREFERNEGIRILDVTSRSDIEALAPDIVHSHHSPCFHYLHSLLPHAVRVHGMLGWIPALEAPPHSGSACDLGLAISEEVLAKIEQTRFAAECDVAIFRNWVDESLVVAADPGVGGKLRVIVVSNHFERTLVNALDSLARSGVLTVDYFGQETRSVKVDGNLLGNYDLVVTIGRTALLAASCGIPCLIADVHGSDGLLTAERLSDLAKVNFSGRFDGTPISEAMIRAELARIPSLDSNGLKAAVLRNYTLGRRSTWLLKKYGELLARRAEVNRDRPSLGNSADFRDTLPQEGIMYADVVQRLAERDQRLGAADCDLRRLISEIKDRDRRLSAADSDLRRLTSAVEDRDRRLGVADGELRRLIGEVEDRDQRLGVADGDLRRLIGEIEDRDLRLGVADGDLRRLVREVEDRDLRLGVADGDLRRLIGEIEDRERQLGAADGDLRRLMGEVEDRGQRLGVVDADLRRLMGEVEDRERRLRAADGDLRRLTGEVEDRDRRFGAIDRDLRRLISEVEDGQQRLIAADLDLRRLIGEVEDRDRRLVAADVDLHRMMVEVEERDQQLRGLIVQIGDRDRLLVAVNEERDRLTLAIDDRDQRLAFANDELRRMLEKADSDLRQANSDIEERDRQLVLARQALGSLTEDVRGRDQRLMALGLRLHEIETSTTWRITAPIRNLFAGWRALFGLKS